MRRTRIRPYWLMRGTEECLLCEHHHVVEMTYRCAACDRGVCSQCAVYVRETHEVFCRPCREEELAAPIGEG